MIEFITPSEFARRLNVTPAAIFQAIKQGRLTAVGGKLDAAVATVEWRTNRKRAPTTRGPDPTTRGPDPTTRGPDPTTPLPQEPDAIPELFESKRRQAFHEANLAALKEAKIAGELVELHEVERAYTTLAAQLRSQLERIPDILSVPLAAERDPEAVHRILVREIDGALADMERAAEQIPDRLIELNRRE